MRLYNTASRKLDELPEPPGPIRMYFCGPTVYQRIHVGNARPFIVSMWLKRWLEHEGYHVTLVENITDINDKIYDAALPGHSAELAAQATEWYLEDTEALGLGRPDYEPRATDTITEITQLIKELIDRGLAYAKGGDVYYRVSRFNEYGLLSGRVDETSIRNPSEEEEPSPLKEDPRDFALWKAQKPSEDTAWDSPWGRGRPGWHIECSAMAEAHLGAEFEIHGGGLDLLFPHHENEIAQSRGAGRRFAKLWMHNGMLRFGGEKMSKSLGNVVTLNDAVRNWRREAILLLFLEAHWRHPLEYSEQKLVAAQRTWLAFEGLYHVPKAQARRNEWSRLRSALNNDFNTPRALALLHEWRSRGYWDLLKLGLDIFGLQVHEMAGTGPTLAELKKVSVEDVGAKIGDEISALSFVGDPPSKVRRLAHERLDARRRGDFARADELRIELEELGWVMQDRSGSGRVVPLP